MTRQCSNQNQRASPSNLNKVSEIGGENISKDTDMIRNMIEYKFEMQI